MLEFHLEATTRLNGEVEYVLDKKSGEYIQKRIQKRIQAPNKMAALIDFNKFLKKSDRSLNFLLKVEAFRVKYDNTRIPLDSDSLREIEKEKEKLMNITC